jgi:hypothetical protein
MQLMTRGAWEVDRTADPVAVLEARLGRPLPRSRKG